MSIVREGEANASGMLLAMRIVSLSPAATEILFSLGLGKDIVCTDQFSNFPEEAKAIPHLRGHTEVRPEELTKFNPDIVLTGTVIQQKLAQELRGKGFQVIHQDARTLAQVFESIRELGVIFVGEERAVELIQKVQREFDSVKRKAKNLPRRPRVYIEEWHQPPMASGNWVPEVVQIAGGKSFPIIAGELSREVMLEEVQAFDPDLIVISWCGAGKLADKKLLIERERWGSLRAVHSGSLKVIDDSFLNRPGPRLAEGAQRLFGWMFEMLH